MSLSCPCKQSRSIRTPHQSTTLYDINHGLREQVSSTSEAVKEWYDPSSGENVRVELILIIAMMFEVSNESFLYLSYSSLSTEWLPC